MKPFKQILGVAALAVTLAACGSNNNQALLSAQQAAAGLNGVQTGVLGGCLPLGSSLPFTATGAQITTTSIKAGQFPSYSGLGTVGTVQMGGNFANNVVGAIQYQPKSSASGQIQISVVGANVTGMIQLSPAIAAQIQASFYNTGTIGAPVANAAQTTCVNSISIWAIQTVMQNFNTGFNQAAASGTGMINEAIVYLNLSTGQSVGPIHFI